MVVFEDPWGVWSFWERSKIHDDPTHLLYQLILVEFGHVHKVFFLNGNRLRRSTSSNCKVLEDNFEGDRHLWNALYGLKQAPVAWYCRIESFFIWLALTPCMYDALFHRRVGIWFFFSMWMGSFLGKVTREDGAGSVCSLGGIQDARSWCFGVEPLDGIALW